MADENPLTGTGDLSPYELRDHANEESPTVAELEEAIKSEGYTLAQLKMLKDAEGTTDRKTAYEALDGAIEDVEDGIPTLGEADSLQQSQTDTDHTMSANESENGAEANSCDEDPKIQKALKGAGATDSGTEGVCLPDPYGDDAPETVRIVTEPLVMGFAGDEYESGEHDVDYNLRVKQGLETATNEVHLSESDPHYPESE
jgi:hypothetical protein